MTATVFDLDGVVWRGGTLIDGAAAAVATARARGPVAFMTNAAFRAAGEVAARLVERGIPATPDDVLTSSGAAAAHCVAGGGGRVLSVGEPGQHATLAAAGLELVDAAPAEWVVAGLDRHVTYERLAAATLAIRGGARFVATNADPNFPLEGGVLAPGAGAIVAFLQRAGGVAPVVAGKPEPTIFALAERRLGASGGDVEMVGDSLLTDIPGAARAGWRTTLVLSGVSTRADIDATPLHARPDRVLDSLADWPGGT